MYEEYFTSNLNLLKQHALRVAKNEIEVNIQGLENHFQSEQSKQMHETLQQWSIILAEKAKTNQVREEELNSLQKTLEDKAVELTAQNPHQLASEPQLLLSEAALLSQESQVDEVAITTSPSDLDNDETVYATPRRSNSHVGQPWRSRSKTF